MHARPLAHRSLHALLLALLLISSNLADGQHWHSDGERDLACVICVHGHHASAVAPTLPLATTHGQAIQYATEQTLNSYGAITTPAIRAPPTDHR